MKLNINGKLLEADASNGVPLLWVVRDQLGLTGTKYGCGAAQCGACTMHRDGLPVRSCVLPAEAVGEAQITTIEGISGPVADAVKTAWMDIDVVQCGYCQPGQVMAATALLATNPKPSDEDIDQAMSGNICRCGTYHRIRAAIHRAAGALNA
ncbi:(2Fe-2S)-binding protein [soil metagenome]